MNTLIVLSLSGFIPGILFFLLGWLTIGGSLLICIFLAISYLANPIFYISFLVAYILSALITLFRANKKNFSSYLQFPSSRRNIYQVLANTGLLAIWAMLYLAYNKNYIFGAYIGTLAAVLADKSGSEIGSLSLNPPKMMFTSQIMPTGTSGARSSLGFFAEIASSFTLGCFVTFLQVLSLGSSIIFFSFEWLVVATISGVVGSLIDSSLGATLQAQYVCPVCHKHTEKKLHCDTPTQLTKGIVWIDNQIVNFSASLVGGLIGMIAVLVWE